MNITKFQPRNAFVLVRRIELPKQEGGIIVPSNEYGNFAFAEILAMGPGNACVSRIDRETAHMGDCDDLKVGDTVLIKTGSNARPMSGQPRIETTLPFKVDGEKVELLNEQAVIAVVTLETPNDND
jgi:co-chaperonin GroES (HSP10)